jgi:hypothetical protein
MADDHFWICVEALSSLFDKDRETVEDHLKAYHEYALGMTAERRAAIRRRLGHLISAMVRFERRLPATDGGER